MDCKKGDFGAVKDRGVSLRNRKLLFYGVCIWVRLGLAYLAYKLNEKEWFPYLIAGIMLLSLRYVKFNKDHCVWWSRKFHHMMVIIILLTSIYQIVTKDKKPLIAVLILIDLIVGVISSFIFKWR